MEEYIALENSIGIPDQRHMMELARMSKILNHDEFQEIVMVYDKAVKRLLNQQKKEK